MEIQVNDGNFKQEVLESSIPALVDFWAPWCMPCRTVAPVIEQIAREYQGKLKVCKANVDEAPQTAAGYKVMSIPTLAVFKNANVVEKVIGAVSKDELENMIKPHL